MTDQATTEEQVTEGARAIEAARSTDDLRAIGQRIREKVEAEAAANDDDDLDEGDEDADDDNAASGHEFFGTLTDEQRAEMIAVAADTIAACIQASGAEGMPCPTCGTGLVPVAYQQSSTHERCQACGGLGKVLTGSLVAGKDYDFCGVCHGNGHTSRLAPVIADFRPVDPGTFPHAEREVEQTPIPIDPIAILTPGPVSQVA